MNDKQLECFLEAAKYLNFTKAAQSLYLPQPAVSRYISALEQELGVALFHRENSRNISLTDEGTLYFNFFQRYYAELNNIRRTLNTNTTKLRLGYNIGWNISSFLPNIIHQLREENPNYNISFECLGFKDLIQAINEKYLDAIIITDDYIEGKNDFTRHIFTDIRRVVVYSDLLPGANQITSPGDFRDYTFYMVDDPKIGSQCQNIEPLFRPYGFVPKFTAVPNINTVFAAVENGLGVAVLDEWYYGIHNPGTHALPLDDTLPISLAWHNSTISPAIDTLYQKIQETYKKK